MIYLLAPVILLIASTEPIGQAAPRIDGTRVEAAMPQRVTDLSISETRVACLLADGAVVILDLADGHVVARVEGERIAPSVIAITPDSEWVATGGIRDWVKFGPPRANFIPGPAGANFNSRHNALGNSSLGFGRAASPEENIRRDRYKVWGRLPSINQGLTRPEGGVVKLWRTSDGLKTVRMGEFPHPVAGMAFDGHNLTLIDTMFSIKLLNKNLDQINVHQNNFPITIEAFPCPQTVFSRDCKRAVCLSAGPGERITLVSCDLTAKRTIVPERANGSAPPWAVAASPDGRRFVTSGAGPGLTVWDMETGRILKTIGPDGGGTDTLFVAFADSRSVITVASDGLIRVVDLELDRAVLTGRGPGADVRAAALDGRRLTLVSGGFQQVGPKVDPLVIWRLPLVPPVGP